MRHLGNGKDLDLYVTVVIAVVVGVLGALDVVGVGVVISATLATLALVAAGSLGSRRQVTRMIASTDELSTLLRQREFAPSADALLTQSTSGLYIDLRGSSDIRMIGVTLSRTIRNHVVDLEQRLQAGAVIRVAVIEPGSDAVREAARRSTVPDAPEIFENRLRPTIDQLSRLAARPNVLGRIKVRLLRFVPSFGLIMVDPDEMNGRIHVDIYSHRTAAPEPVLVLSPHREPRWTLTDYVALRLVGSLRAEPWTPLTNEPGSPDNRRSSGTAGATATRTDELTWLTCGIRPRVIRRSGLVWQGRSLCAHAGL